MIRASLFVLIFVVLACNAKTKNPYDISNYFDKAAQDTLMTNIITYIYKVPKGVKKEDKFNPEYRQLYVNQIEEFKWVYYHVDVNDQHYFYLIRPARNVKGYKRGVAGSFRLKVNLELDDFREILNTPMQPEDEILEKSEYLWKDLMYFKHVDRYLYNRDFIEFPSEGCKYDFEKKEWRYDVGLNILDPVSQNPL